MADDGWDDVDEAGYDGPVDWTGRISPNHPAHPRWHLLPEGDVRACHSMNTLGEREHQCGRYRDHDGEHCAVFTSEGTEVFSSWK